MCKKRQRTPSLSCISSGKEFMESSVVIAPPNPYTLPLPAYGVKELRELRAAIDAELLTRVAAAGLTTAA